MRRRHQVGSWFGVHRFFFPPSLPLSQVTGTRLWACLFSSWNDLHFVFYPAATTAARLVLCRGSYTSPLTHK